MAFDYQGYEMTKLFIKMMLQEEPEEPYLPSYSYRIVAAAWLIVFVFGAWFWYGVWRMVGWL